MKATCLQCNKDFEYGYSSTGKFCSNQCSGLNKKTEYKHKFFSGLLKQIERSTARKYLAEERGYNCEVCGIRDWQGKPITLQVDHTDGNAGNNNPNNLRLICPNCHSQTDTFSARNKGNGRAARGLPLR
jgi:rubrerythrin